MAQPFVSRLRKRTENEETRGFWDYHTLVDTLFRRDLHFAAKV